MGKIDKPSNLTPTAGLFAELTRGAADNGENFILNTGDVGMVRSLERLSAAEASASTNGGATIAAHAQHVRYGLSLMNRWARQGGNPFADAKWDEAWKTSTVDDAAWTEIRNGLTAEIDEWAGALNSKTPANGFETAGMISSVAHLAYHLGAIRQISKATRGPKEGNFVKPPSA
jgi:hypothetical protein